MRGHVPDLCVIQQRSHIEWLLSRQLMTYFFMQVHHWNQDYGPALADRLWALMSTGQGLDQGLDCIKGLSSVIFHHIMTPPHTRPQHLKLNPDILRPLSQETHNPVDLDLSVCQAAGHQKESFIVLFLQAIHVTLIRPFLPQSIKKDGIKQEMCHVSTYCQIIDAFVTQTGSTAFTLTQGWENVLNHPMSVYTTGEDQRRPKLSRYSRALVHHGSRITTSLATALQDCRQDSLGSHTLEEYQNLASSVIDYHHKIISYLETGVNFALMESRNSRLNAISLPSPNMAPFWVYLRAMAEWLAPSAHAPAPLSDLLEYFSTGRGTCVPQHREDPDPAAPLRSDCPSTKMFLRTVMETNRLTSQAGISFILWWCVTGQGFKTRKFCDPIGFPDQIEDIWAPLSRWTVDDGPCDNAGSLGWSNASQSFTGLGTFRCTDTDRDLSLQRMKTWFSPELQKEWLDWLHTDAREVLRPGRGATKTWLQGWNFMSQTVASHVSGFGRGLLAYLAANLLSYVGITTPCSLGDMDTYLTRMGHSPAQALEFLGLPTRTADERRCSFRLLHCHLARRLSPEIQGSIRLSPDSLMHSLTGFYRFVTLQETRIRKVSFKDLDGSKKLIVWGRELGEEPGEGLLRWDERDILTVYGSIPNFLALPYETGPKKRAREPETRNSGPSKTPRTEGWRQPIVLPTCEVFKESSS